MKNFLYSLFGKRKRRILILARWHAQPKPPIETPQNTLESITQAFITCLLKEPIVLSLYKTHIKVFNVQGMHIPHEWLFPHEMQYINDLYARRFEVNFKSRDTFVNGTFALTGLREAELSIQHRRELVRDFIWMVSSRKADEHLWKYTLLVVFQQLLLRDRDPLIVGLHAALQGRANLREILCV